MAEFCDVRVAGETEPIFGVLLPHCLYLNEATCTLVGLWTDVVWCCTCQTFRAGERFRSEADIASQIAGFHRGDFPESPARMDLFYGGTDAETIGRHLRNWERELQWRRIRQSPPKCLTCGATELIRFDWTNPGLLVEPSSGRLFTLGSVFATGDFDWEVSLYSTEGDFLAKIDRWDHERNRMLDDGSDPDLVTSRLNKVRADRDSTSAG